MGILYGWHTLQDGVTLTGVVSRLNATPASDGDWCMIVQPDPQFVYLQRNPAAPSANSDGIECEIEPPNNLQGRNAEDTNVVLGFLNPMLNRRVTVQGAWVVDLQHRWDGATSPCIFSPCNDGKTEIHPITSILHERNRPAPYTRRFDWFVFSDDSLNFPNAVPFSGQNRVGTFSIPTPQGSTWNVSQEIDMSRSKHFDIVQTATGWQFVGTVQSGTAGEGHGFYHALLDLHEPQPTPLPTMRVTVQHRVPLPWNTPTPVTVRAFDVGSGAEILGAEVGVGPGSTGRWDVVGHTPARFQYTFNLPEGQDLPLDPREGPHDLPRGPMSDEPIGPPHWKAVSYWARVNKTGYEPGSALIAQQRVRID